MKFLLTSLLILLLPAVAQDVIIREGVDESGNPDDYSDNSRLFDVLFLQYRGVFRDLLGRRCVYYPSCSHFCQEAIESRGPVIGIMMALERWTRCTSAAFSHGDYRIIEGNILSDPVDPGEEAICWGQLLLPF